MLSDLKSPFRPQNRSFLEGWWRTVDRTLLAIFVALILTGIVMVMAASPAVATRIGADQFFFIKHHVLYAMASMVCLLGFSFLSPRGIWRAATLMFGAAVILMIAVLLFGAEIKGAKRWIGVLGFSLQPSEFIKPAFAIVSAWILSHHLENHQKYKGIMVTGGVWLLIVSLLMAQPDFGMTVVTTCIWLAQIFLAGLPFRIVVILLGLGVFGIYAMYSLFPHVHERIDGFLNPETSDNYQINYSLDAFREGGIFGRGPGEGVVKLRLPDAHADFIFSVIGEEFGLIFTLLVIGIYFFVILRGMNRALNSENLFIILVVGGLLSMFGLQTFIHMGSAIKLLPPKGMTLPFLSYGGSSILAMGIAMGVVLSLTRRHASKGVSQAGIYRKNRTITG
jgi:cell division protein FtsW